VSLYTIAGRDWISCNASHLATYRLSFYFEVSRRTIAVFCRHKKLHHCRGRQIQLTHQRHSGLPKAGNTLGKVALSSRVVGVTFCSACSNRRHRNMWKTVIFK